MERNKFDKLLLSVKEASEYSGLGRDAILRLTKNSSLNLGKMNGQKRLVYRPALDEYIKKNKAL